MYVYRGERGVFSFKEKEEETEGQAREVSLSLSLSQPLLSSKVRGKERWVI